MTKTPRTTTDNNGGDENGARRHRASHPTVSTTTAAYGDASAAVAGLTRRRRGRPALRPRPNAPHILPASPSPRLLAAAPLRRRRRPRRRRHRRSSPLVAAVRSAHFQVAVWPIALGYPETGALAAAAGRGTFSPRAATAGLCLAACMGWRPLAEVFLECGARLDGREPDEEEEEEEEEEDEGEADAAMREANDIEEEEQVGRDAAMHPDCIRSGGSSSTAVGLGVGRSARRQVTGKPSLYHPAESGHASMVDHLRRSIHLLEHGAEADPDATTDHPLFAAAGSGTGSASIAERLLDRGEAAVGVDGGDSPPPPLCAATIWGHLGLVRLLHERGGAPITGGDRGEPARGGVRGAAHGGGRVPCSRGAGPNDRTRGGPAPLSSACGRAGAVAVLARHGADLAARNANRTTPLMAAAAEGQIAAVVSLVEVGGGRRGGAGLGGATVLFFAARNGARGGGPVADMAYEGGKSADFAARGAYQGDHAGIVEFMLDWGI
ncbi:hypothetical protein DFJ73DRAFT_897263 [Zopfochytrium polystomum]|nr:hypothetical protein DFJ73DRAFT_897263 [Zopfochytrium polystomum]